jgi:hypothetical protein
VYSKKGRVFEVQTIRRYARSGNHNLTPVRKEWLLDSWGRIQGRLNMSSSCMEGTRVGKCEKSSGLLLRMAHC